MAGVCLEAVAKQCISPEEFRDLHECLRLPILTGRKMTTHSSLQQISDNFVSPTITTSFTISAMRVYAWQASLIF